MGKRLRVTTPLPHLKQQELDSISSKRIVVNAGRRAGKTTWAARKSIREAHAGRRVLYIAPVSAQTDSYWSMVCEWLGDAIALGLVKKNEQRRTLTFPNGGTIQARTGNKPDHLRGMYGDYIILDEYAFQDPEVWEKIVQPMLLDNDGTAVFISTPNMRNHFYHLYLKALQEDSWEVITFSSLDNPHLSEIALEAMSNDMLPDDYRQEILAEFVEGEGTVFSLKKELFIPALDVVIADHKTHRLCAGLDWGQKNDFTALSVGCATCEQELGLYRTNKIAYQDQRDFLKLWLAKYERYIELLAEGNSIGQPNIEALRRDGLHVNTFTMSNSSKATLVQTMRLALFEGSWRWIADKVGWNELESYEMKVTQAGNRTYSAPYGLNDDTVVARMLMLHQALQGQLQVY